MQIAFFAIALTLLSISNAQANFIDLDRVTPSVKKRLIKLGVEKFTSTEDFVRSCDDSFDPQKYFLHKMEFNVDQGVETLWFNYLTSDPKTNWTGNLMTFDFAFSRVKNEVYYHDSQNIPLSHVGMGFMLDLNIYHIKHLPVALEISKIDHGNHTIEFTYLTASISHGKHVIQFVELAPERSKIIHITYYKSGKKFRDKRLYPGFHEDFIEDFHHNVSKLSGPAAVRTL